MFSHLKTFSALYFLIALGIVIFCYNLKLSEVENDRDRALNMLAAQNIAVEQWKAAAQNAEKKQREKESVAEKNMEQAKKDALTILNHPVNDGCDNAIKDGIDFAIKSRQP